jgi:hypothetical protein
MQTNQDQQPSSPKHRQPMMMMMMMMSYNRMMMHEQMQFREAEKGTQCWRFLRHPGVVPHGMKIILYNDLTAAVVPCTRQIVAL